MSLWERLDFDVIVRRKGSQQWIPDVEKGALVAV